MFKEIIDNCKTDSYLENDPFGLRYTCNNPDFRGLGYNHILYRCSECGRVYNNNRGFKRQKCKCGGYFKSYTCKSLGILDFIQANRDNLFLCSKDGEKLNLDTEFVRVIESYFNGDKARKNGYIHETSKELLEMCNKYNQYFPNVDIKKIMSKAECDYYFSEEYCVNGYRPFTTHLLTKEDGTLITDDRDMMLLLTKYYLQSINVK